MKDLIQRCDVGTTDAFTTGDTIAHTTVGRFKHAHSPQPELAMNIALLTATLVVAAASSPTNDVHVQAVKNFGSETKTLGVDLFPEGD
jgi:hypothetical protein